MLNFQNDLVSVIIPVYNADRHLAETLASVARQTYKMIEIIIVDDCSTDSSRTIIENFKSRFAFTHYHRLEKNSGAAVARNKALELATGRYIAFLDSDDMWHSNKIELQLKFIKDKNAAICFTAVEVINEKNNKIKVRTVLPKIDYNFLLKNTMIATSSALVDRNITGKFQMPLMRTGQDYATWLKLLRNNCWALGLNMPLTMYRKSQNSLSSKKINSLKEVWTIQTRLEGIHPVKAMLNTICFALNAFKKHFLA